MDKSKHVVTIPMEDYNKLMAASEFEGLIEITPDNRFYNMLKIAVEIDYRQAHHREPQTNLMELFTFYAKKI